MNDLPFRELIDAAPDGLIVCEPAGRILLVNAEAARMFGYGRDELVGQSIDVLVPKRVRPYHARHMASFTDAPRLRPMGSGLDLHGSRKDGTEFPVEISLSPMHTAKGLLITAGIRDISERRVLEGEKRRATAYLTSAVEAVSESFALFDEHDRLVMLNSTARELLGSDVGHAITGMSFEELLRGALERGAFDFSSESKQTLLDRWLAYHREPRGTLDVRTGTGRYLRVTERKTAEHGTVSTIADVTDDVQRESDLRQARAAAEAASAAKSEFLSSMSHELRTPLNAVLGFAQLLERDRKNPLDARQIERVQHVLRGGEHLLRLIDDVLDLAKIESGRVAVSVEEVALGSVLNEVITTLEPMATRAGVRLEVGDLPDRDVIVLADRTRLAQILMNFGSNSIKYGRRDGFVRFEVKPVATRVHVAVIDNGIGIPESQRDRIFEPFQRAGQETGPIEGTGIGLAISKRLASLMHGTVDFTSVLGEGSTFWIDVPAHREAAESSPTLRAASGPLSTLSRPDPARFKVVYVEDNPSNIAFMRDVMEELTSIELLTAPTAEIGLELIAAHQPALVIMDINLPGMSGVEAVKILKARPETRSIPVIGLSAAALPSDSKRAVEVGFQRYLTKPVKIGELTAALEELLVPS